MKNFSIKKRLASFKYAMTGLKALLLFEHNSRIHLTAAIFAIIFGIFLKISPFEWLIVILAIGLVFVTELLNSAIEKLADMVSQDFNEKIRHAKDYGAAAVLISSIVAFVAGVILFGPKIFECFK